MSFIRIITNSFSLFLLGIQSSGLLQQGRAAVVLHEADVRVTSSVLVINQKRPLPAQRHRHDRAPIARERAGEQVWHTVRVLKQWETGVLSQDHLERMENYYQGRKRVLQ